MLHEHFRKQTRRKCLESAYAVGAYELALDAACIRGRKLWAEPESLKLLHDGAAALIARLGPGKASRQTLAVVDAAWSRTALVKYARVPVEVFADDLPQLGPDAAEGFDDSLLTVEAYQRAQQQQQNTQRAAQRLGLHGLLERHLHCTQPLLLVVHGVGGRAARAHRGAAGRGTAARAG